MLKKILKPSTPLLPRFLHSPPLLSTFSVTTTARVTPQNELFYKRDLPPNLIPFSSLEGKKLFQQAYKQGNMEAYFTLAEHLINQAEPSTCGPTSLSMIVNTLHIDPNRHWKGVWKWSSEYNLYCCPEDYIKNGLNFEQFANLAHCNRTKLQAFYHSDTDSQEIPLITKGEHSGKIIHSKIDFHHEGVCLNQHGLLLKHSSYTTFLNSLVASSRRTGLYMVMNFSRPHLGQTGDGHFNPVAGLNLTGKTAKALILDLAKFKYPAYWVDLEIMYESMRQKDNSTGKSRGFVLISANKEINPSSRGISDDVKSVEGFNRHVKGVGKKIGEFIKEYESKYGKKPADEEVMYMTLIHLGRDCNYLLTYYLYDLSIRLESKSEKELGLFGEFEKLENTKLCSLIKSGMVSNYKSMSNHQIFWLVYDYQASLMANVLTMLLYALEKHVTVVTGQDMSHIFNERNLLSEPLKQEIVKIQKIFGL